VLTLETTKIAQANEIANLKKRVKRLERARKSRTHGLKRLYKVGLSARVVSFADKESLGEEDASKQGMISDIDANQDIYLVNVHKDEEIFGLNDQDDTSMFDADKDLQGENAPPTLKDPKFWPAEEKKTRKIDRLARSLLIQGILNDIYSLIDSNKTAKDLWDALERQIRGSKYGEQDRKAAILYEYKTFKATEREQLLDTYLRYLQYGTLIRQTKNLMDINIDALYNILKQNQGDVNDALGYKKKAVMVTSDPLALVAEKTKINALLAKAFNQKKYYAKLTNNNLRTSSASSLANKKPDDEQVLLAEDQAWMESSSDSDQEINANMVFIAQIEKVLSDLDESSSSAEETITEVAYYTSESESEYEYETLENYDNSTNYGLFVNDNDDQQIFHDAIESASENFMENYIDSQKDYDKSEVDRNDS
nr:RNA-directed DNA polymerase, eukaryota [Tanacetum cinerariifolium]